MTAGRRLTVAVMAAITGACRHTAPPLPEVVTVAMPTVPAEAPWESTLARVKSAIDSGRFRAADSLLTEFERAAPDTADLSDSAFWRTLLRVDARNPAFTPADARAALQQYLASPATTHGVEASVLLGLLGTADSLRAAMATQRAVTEQRDHARDEEMQKLRDELQRTQAELDRIKKRLAPPKKP